MNRSPRGSRERLGEFIRNSQVQHGPRQWPAGPERAPGKRSRVPERHGRRARAKQQLNRAAHFTRA